ncbi:MAG: hypothetical protein J3R72DRAFT_476094 [Linnemannia gamsii]|nr:MAG: hypothetical protein J3R72DRAFT_476094 [Linnemannia gamsii]
MQQMTPKTKDLSVLLQLPHHPFLLLSPVLLIFVLTVNAQAPPTLRRRSAYTSYNNQFYIHGGILPTVKTGSNEFNSLDLATSWSTTTATTAPWTTLPAGNQVWHHAIVAIEPKFTAGLGTGTQGYILAVAGTPLNGPGYWTAYDIQSKQWRTIAATPADTTFTPYVELEGHTATVDPSTGLVYVIGGFNGLISNAPLPGSVNLLTVFDPKTAKILSQEQATTGTSLTGANAVWSTKRGTVLLLGGSRAVATISVTGLDMTVLTEYNPTSKQWTSMRTSGAIPPARLDACADVTDDGSKVIVYGGAANANTYLSSIYILDLTTGVWTAGPPTTGVLSQATCAYNAGQFIVFAGSISATDMNSLAEATPLVFDVNNGAWVTSFTASSGGGGGNGSGGNSGSGSLTTPTHPMGSGGDGPGDSDATEGKSHTGAIIGAIAGVLVLLLIGLAVYLVRMRRRRNLKKVQDTEAKAVALLAAEGKDDRKNNEPKIMTAADHYAAAQAALEEASKRIRPSAFKSPKSWTSEANSNSVSDGNSTAVSKARRLSDPEVKADPALYYQQLLLKQRQLQRQHPHLIGGLASRSPHSSAGGGHLGVSGDDSESDCSSNKSDQHLGLGAFTDDRTESAYDWQGGEVWS